MARAPKLSHTAIVTAAREQVAAKGIGELSMRPLAAQLGVTAPALYAHFPSKSALVEAVADAEFSRLIDQLQAAAVGVEPPVDRIRAQMRAYVDYAIANPALFEVL